MGNPDGLSGPAPRRGAERGQDRKTWGRTCRYGAGMVSMLTLSMAGSLALWIALPWLFLGWSPALVTSGSMQPLVTAGDVVMVRPTAPDELGLNTVVLFERSDGVRVLHRIVEQAPDGTFRTRGDANDVPDSDPLRAEQVVGAAVLAVPWIGRPSLWLSEGRVPRVVAGGVVLVAMLALAPRAFDPAYDPWAAGQRISPAEVLLGRGTDGAERRRSTTGHRLLPGGLHDVVLDRLAAQSTAVQHRTTHLIGGSS